MWASSLRALWSVGGEVMCKRSQRRTGRVLAWICTWSEREPDSLDMAIIRETGESERDDGTVDQSSLLHLSCYTR